MKAIIQTRYGPPEVLKLEDVEQPSPKPGEILIKVRASTVNNGECKVRGFKGIPPVFWLPARLMFGLFRPKFQTLGCDFSGVIEALGEGVTRFNVGDEIFGSSLKKYGAWAEYLTLSESSVMAIKPESLTHEEAASLPNMGMDSLFFLKLAKLEAGQSILIYGASGGVGTAAVQHAKRIGAEVTGVCSTGNVEMVQGLGADHVIDYMNENFWTCGLEFDVVFDTVGFTEYLLVKRILKPGGVYVQASFGLRKLLQMMLVNVFGKHRIECAVSGETQEALDEVKTAVEAGEHRAVIDRVYTIQEMVEAHRYVEAGHKKGNVVISIASPEIP